MEVFFERLMYAARWLLAPIYIGLSAALLALAIKFFQEVFPELPTGFGSRLPAPGLTAKEF